MKFMCLAVSRQGADSYGRGRRAAVGGPARGQHMLSYPFQCFNGHLETKYISFDFKDYYQVVRSARLLQRAVEPWSSAVSNEGRLVILGSEPLGAFNFELAEDACGGCG